MKVPSRKYLQKVPLKLNSFINNIFSYRVSKREKFMRLQGCGIKSMRPIFKTEMFINQSKANLDEKICFGKITHL